MEENTEEQQEETTTQDRINYKKLQSNLNKNMKSGSKKGIKNAVKGAFKKAGRVVIKSVGKVVLSLLRNPYVLIALAVIILGAAAYFQIKELFSQSSVSNASTSVENIASAEDADPQTKSLASTYEVNRSFLTATIKDVNKIYNDYITALSESDPTNALSDMKSIFGTDDAQLEEMKFESNPSEYSKPIDERNSSTSTQETSSSKDEVNVTVTQKVNSSSKVNSTATTDKYPTTGTYVLPSQKRELYKHMLMTEKYNFNMIKWKLYKASGVQERRTLPSQPTDYQNFVIEPSLALRIPKSNDKTVDYFIQLVEPYLQSNLFPISMYSMSINSDSNSEQDGKIKNAEFAYAIISQAYSDITMNVYELEDYTENWSHEEWDVGEGQLLGTVQCLRLPKNLFYICKEEISIPFEEVLDAYCEAQNYTEVDKQHLLNAGNFAASQAYKDTEEQLKNDACLKYATVENMVSTTDKKAANQQIKNIVNQFNGKDKVTYSYNACTFVEGTEVANKEQETITSTGQKTEDQLVSTKSEITTEYKPYRIKSFDIVLEYEYNFEVYNVTNSPDSISTSSTNLADENVSKDINYAGYETVAGSLDCVDDNNVCDGEFTAIVGTYVDKVNRRRVDTTKNWSDKLSASSNGFSNRKYKASDVIEFIAEKQGKSTSEVKLSEVAKEYYNTLEKDKKINRIDLINAVYEIYKAYMDKYDADDNNIAIKQTALDTTYNVLIKRLQEIEEDGILPYIYGQTLGLNLKYEFEEDSASNCSNTNNGLLNGKGGYKWPVPNNTYVSSLFGYTPIYGTNHEGIDVWETQQGGSTGEVDIVAAKEGIVYSAKDDKIASNTTLGNGGYGNHIIIKHSDGKYTLYGHLETGTFTVKTGDYVKAGQTLAKMGSSGNSSGWHLHFNISSEPYSLCEDPLLYFNVEPASSSYPEYSKVDKSTINEFNAYKVVGEKTVNGINSLDGFLFFGDSRLKQIESNLTALGSNISVIAVDSSTQSEWIDVVKNSSGTIQGESVTLGESYSGISVSLGINDIQNSSAMISLLDALLSKYPNTKIYVQSVYPVATGYTYTNASELNSDIKEFNTTIKNKCANNDNLVYIDITTDIAESSGYLKSEYTTDNTNINTSSGKEKLASNIKDAILTDNLGFTNTQNKYSVALQVTGVEDVGTSTSDANLAKYKSDRYWGYITNNSDLYEVDPYLIAAIMTQECGRYDENYYEYRPYEGNGNDVYGLGQKTVPHGTQTISNNVKDKNGGSIGTVNLQKEFLGNADLQIKFICAEIKYKLDLWHGNVCAALLSYNYGDAGAMNKFKQIFGLQNENEIYTKLENEKTNNSWISQTNGYPSLVLRFYDIQNSGTYAQGLYDCIEQKEVEITENVVLSGSYVGDGKEEGDDSANKGYFTNAGGTKYHTYNQSAYGTFWTNNGCGPTSCAIVLSGLTGVERDPNTIFDLKGYTNFETDLIPLLDSYNIKSTQYYRGKKSSGNYYGNIIDTNDRKFILEQLAKGYPIIIYIKPGGTYNNCHYNGHFMTLLGAKDNGDVYVADPGGWGRDGWISLEKLANEAFITTYLVCQP